MAEINIIVTTNPTQYRPKLQIFMYMKDGTEIPCADEPETIAQAVGIATEKLLTNDDNIEHIEVLRVETIREVRWLTGK